MIKNYIEQTSLKKKKQQQQNVDFGFIGLVLILTKMYKVLPKKVKNTKKNQSFSPFLWPT